MKTEIVIWEIDRASRAGTKLDLAKRVETEEMLEAVLVANPNILMRGLTLVGRQVPVETGYVDLLGVDEDGRLVVFELKREEAHEGCRGTDTRLLQLLGSPIGFGTRNPDRRAFRQGWDQRYCGL